MNISISKQELTSILTGYHNRVFVFAGCKRKSNQGLQQQGKNMIRFARKVALWSDPHVVANVLERLEETSP